VKSVGQISALSSFSVTTQESDFYECLIHHFRQPDALLLIGQRMIIWHGTT